MCLRLFTLCGVYRTTPGTFLDNLFLLEVNRTDLLKMYLVGMQLMFDLLCDLPALENLRLLRGIPDGHWVQKRTFEISLVISACVLNRKLL
jgi:hypothetical protein